MLTLSKDKITLTVDFTTYEDVYAAQLGLLELIAAATDSNAGRDVPCAPACNLLLEMLLTPDQVAALENRKR